MTEPTGHLDPEQGNETDNTITEPDLTEPDETHPALDVGDAGLDEPEGMEP